jgi:hypothetical protein
VPAALNDGRPPEENAERSLVGLRVAIGCEDPPGVPRDLGWSLRAAPADHKAPDHPAELEALLHDGRRIAAQLPFLELRMGSVGPGQILLDRNGEPLDRDFPTDCFVIGAVARPVLPAGRWLVVARADDSVRVRVNGALVVDAWASHGERADVGEFTLSDPGPVELRVEYHEASSFAALMVDVVPD